MSATVSIEERIRSSYASLSEKLQVAADYVADNPIDVASRSLRSVASTSGVSPATFSRLARALGYDDYEQMREDRRAAVSRRLTSFSERAQLVRLNEEPPDAEGYLHHQATACIANIGTLTHEMTNAQLDAAVDVLHEARSVLVVGSLGSSGIVDYFAYLAQWFCPNWQVAGRNGAALGSTTARLGPEDALVALAKAPYARRTIAALNVAKTQGVSTVVFTDNRKSPAVEFADHVFVVPSDSPQFFSSYAATLVLIEALMTMLLARAGPTAEDMIRDAEQQIHRLGETW